MASHAESAASPNRFLRSSRLRTFPQHRHGVSEGEATCRRFSEELHMCMCMRM